MDVSWLNIQMWPEWHIAPVYSSQQQQQAAKQSSDSGVVSLNNTDTEKHS